MVIQIPQGWDKFAIPQENPNSKGDMFEWNLDGIWVGQLQFGWLPNWCGTQSIQEYTQSESRFGIKQENPLKLRGDSM